MFSGCQIGRELEIGEITTLEALESLHDQWSALWGRCPEATPFQSPDWLVPWWRHLGHGALWVLSVRAEGRLVGVAPFFIAESDGKRLLSLLGTGITDYLDVLLEPSFIPAGIEGF